MRAAAVWMLLCPLLSAADEPLRTADLLRYLRSGISERVILAEIRERGVAEPLGATSMEALRESGASPAVKEALARATPLAPAAASPAPPRVSAPAPPSSKSDIFASSPVGRPGWEAPTFGASTQSVSVPVSVVDKKGKPVLGLTAQDFAVTEEGRKQTVSFFSAERKPLRLAEALDVSGSMEDRWKRSWMRSSTSSTSWSRRTR